MIAPASVIGGEVEEFSPGDWKTAMPGELPQLPGHLSVMVAAWVWGSGRQFAQRTLRELDHIIDSDRYFPVTAHSDPKGDPEQDAAGARARPATAVEALRAAARQRETAALRLELPPSRPCLFCDLDLVVSVHTDEAPRVAHQPRS